MSYNLSHISVPHTFPINVSPYSLWSLTSKSPAASQKIG